MKLLIACLPLFLLTSCGTMTAQERSELFSGIATLTTHVLEVAANTEGLPEDVRAELRKVVDSDIVPALGGLALKGSEAVENPSPLTTSEMLIAALGVAGVAGGTWFGKKSGRKEEAAKAAAPPTSVA